MNDYIFKSESFQRVFHYLEHLDREEDLDDFLYQDDIFVGDPQSCLQVLLK